MLQTTLCYIEQAGRYLMLHRVKKENDVNHDKWIGIGGKLEPGETPEQCLLREAREETGLTLTRWRCCGVVAFHSPPWPSEEMHLYHATGFTGDLIDCDEGVLEWVPIEEMDRLGTWEGDRIFLRLLAQGAPFFRLTLRYDGDRLTEAELDGRALPVPGWEAAL